MAGAGLFLWLLGSFLWLDLHKPLKQLSVLVRGLSGVFL